MQINKIFTKIKDWLIPTAICLVLVMMPLSFATATESAWLNKVKNNVEPAGNSFGVAAGEAPKDIRVIIVNIIEVILGLLALIFVILIIAAGFKWMTAQGTAAKIDQARHTMTQAAIGLGIILAAFAITIFISRSIVGSTAGTEAVEGIQEYQSDLNAE